MIGSQNQAAVLSQLDGKTNGSNIHHNPIASNHTPAVARTTKGKYSLPDFELKRTLGTGSFGRPVRWPG